MDRLRAMELFLSISQTQNFSETARRFGISATAVSRMITDTENELKVKLLLRSTRQVVLTESGQEYARQLEGILWQINALQGNITAISTAPQGLLRVHSRTMFGLGLLPPLIAGFRKLYPDIHIELTLTEAAVDLRRNQIDIEAMHFMAKPFSVQQIADKVAAVLALVVSVFSVVGAIRT